jgi:hypothetical protein
MQPHKVCLSGIAAWAPRSDDLIVHLLHRHLLVLRDQFQSPLEVAKLNLACSLHNITNSTAIVACKDIPKQTHGSLMMALQTQQRIIQILFART